jgi:hypothetical protein
MRPLSEDRILVFGDLGFTLPPDEVPRVEPNKNRSRPSLIYEMQLLLTRHLVFMWTAAPLLRSRKG